MRSTRLTSWRLYNVVVSRLSSSQAQAARELLADLLAAWTGTSSRRMGRSVVNYAHTCRARWPCSTRSKATAARPVHSADLSRARRSDVA